MINNHYPFREWIVTRAGSIIYQIHERVKGDEFVQWKTKNECEFLHPLRHNELVITSID